MSDVSLIKKLEWNEARQQWLLKNLDKEGTLFRELSENHSIDKWDNCFSINDLARKLGVTKDKPRLIYISLKVE